MKFIFSSICLVALSTMFIFGNCSKSGGGTIAATENYSPITTGSSWTYLNSPGGVTKLTVTTKDTVVAARTYKVLTSSNGANNYRAKIGGDYYRYGVIPTIGAGGIDELYLKDGQSVNGTWNATQNFTIPGFPSAVAATFTYVVKEKGISKTVASKVYTDVIHVRLDVTVLLIGNIGGGDFYYANNIGLIDGALTISAPGQAAISQAQVLTSHEIK